MVRVYDNWERLVEAVCRREELRQLSLEDSRSPSTRSFDSDTSFSSISESFRIPPSPLNPNLVKPKLLNERKRSGNGKRRWKDLSIFSGFSFSSKKNYGRKERELQCAEADQRTLHGLGPMKNAGALSKKSHEEVSTMDEEAKMSADIARLRELHSQGSH